ncbi:large ribosomal subunit protein bL20m isoform X2 [Desmodus rotundus]|uniref:large ribosomal subunit protein bL20m isoform X2 n=1 Tax=Desmodus rotundus TaxID=9430 RepID=UPI0023812A58|nr:39S ribosomal protein L20, mitochondrial isoform X2 [Desmodus rotundus]
MVFLTAQLWLRSRVTDRYWRVQEVLKHARHFRGRKNRCYRLAVRAVIRAFVKCTKARRLKRRNLRTEPGGRSPAFSSPPQEPPRRRPRSAQPPRCVCCLRDRPTPEKGEPTGPGYSDLVRGPAASHAVCLGVSAEHHLLRSARIGLW